MSAPLPASVRQVTASNGFSRLEVANRHATASVYLYGAQVAAFQPAGGAPVLFFSEESYYQPGKPMRGGVPIIFPWFGPHPTDAAKPAHGFARTHEWTLKKAEETAEGETRLVLELQPDVDSIRLWPEGGDQWTLLYTITVGAQLRLELEIRNEGPNAMEVEDALHSYFSIQDIHEAEVHGLENTSYLTIIEDLPRKNQGPDAIRFTRETDRVYLDTADQVRIRDGKRTILIEKEDAASVIVWNPWSTKAAQMADMGESEWPRMLCVETGNAKENRLHLRPGETHRSLTAISIEGNQGNPNR